MEPEHRLLLRRTYARNLPAFVSRQVPGLLGWPPVPIISLWYPTCSFVCRLGIQTIRHLKRLERVILGYLEVYDGPEEEARLKILETLKLLMQYTWPRYSSQADRCAKRGKTQQMFSLELAQTIKYMAYI